MVRATLLHADGKVTRGRVVLGSLFLLDIVTCRYFDLIEGATYAERDQQHSPDDGSESVYRKALESIRDMMSPKNRERFVMQGPLAWIAVYNVVEEALK